jgi:hypothetical protein
LVYHRHNTTIDIDVGFLSSTVKGITAIDNVTYTKGLCDHFSTTTTSTSTTLTTLVSGNVSTSTLEISPSTPQHDLTTKLSFDSELSCDFETVSARERLCGFYLKTNSGLISTEEVSRGHGFTRNGPLTDHTLSRKDGWFLIFERNVSYPNQTENSEARFIYPHLVSNKSSRCLFFWYQLGGNKLMTLSVGVATSPTGIVRLWRVKQEVKQWTLAAVLLDADGPFDIEFIVTLETNSTSTDEYSTAYVALDDIVVEMDEECTVSS